MCDLGAEKGAGRTEHDVRRRSRESVRVNVDEIKRLGLGEISAALFFLG